MDNKSLQIINHGLTTISHWNLFSELLFLRVEFSFIIVRCRLKINVKHTGLKARGKRLSILLRLLNLVLFWLVRLNNCCFSWLINAFLYLSFLFLCGLCWWQKFIFLINIIVHNGWKIINIFQAILWKLIAVCYWWVFILSGACLSHCLKISTKSTYCHLETFGVYVRLRLWIFNLFLIALPSRRSLDDQTIKASFNVWWVSLKKGQDFCLFAHWNFLEAKKGLNMLVEMFT